MSHLEDKGFLVFSEGEVVIVWYPESCDEAAVDMSSGLSSKFSMGIDLFSLIEELVSF